MRNSVSKALLKSKTKFKKQAFSAHFQGRKNVFSLWQFVSPNLKFNFIAICTFKYKSVALTFGDQPKRSLISLEGGCWAVGDAKSSRARSLPLSRHDPDGSPLSSNSPFTSSSSSVGSCPVVLYFTATCSWNSLSSKSQGLAYNILPQMKSAQLND